MGAELNITALDEDREPSLKRLRAQSIQGGDRVSHVGTVVRNIQKEVGMCRGPETFDTKSMKQQLQRP